MRFYLHPHFEKRSWNGELEQARMGSYFQPYVGVCLNYSWSYPLPVVSSFVLKTMEMPRYRAVCASISSEGTHSPLCRIYSRWCCVNGCVSRSYDMNFPGVRTSTSLQHLQLISSIRRLKCDVKSSCSIVVPKTSLCSDVTLCDVPYFLISSW